MKGKLRWKRNPAETGLRSIGAAPRGYTLHDGEEKFAWVNPNGGGYSCKQEGWYWVVLGRPDVPLFNSCATPVADVETAKKEAVSYLKSYLGKGA